MKVHLMHTDQDFDMNAELPANELALTEDLGLGTLFEAMARGDEFLFEVARRAVLSSLASPEEIGYRQRILQDCLAHPAVIRQIYDLAVEAAAGSKKIYRGVMSQSPDSVLRWSLEMLQLFTGILRRLRRIADEHAGGFRSEGFAALFSMLSRELRDDYFDAVDEHLRRLRFRDGVLVSAELGKGNKGVRYVLRKADRVKQGWRSRMSGNSRPTFTLKIDPRDESGHKTLAELRGRGINLAANALAQSADHVLSFLVQLRYELGFYVGCLTVHEQLAQKGEPLCFPVPRTAADLALSFRSLYDVCLSLRLADRAVGNDVSADGRSLVMITGANQGGKSTFLRSIGLAQLMMQCGMFVGAESFSGSVCERLFTHYRREEDSTMESGKLDEELSRMSEIADSVVPYSMVLFNESFAATNEREGSEIARQITRALLESGIRIFFCHPPFRPGLQPRAESGESGPVPAGGKTSRRPAHFPACRRRPASHELRAGSLRPHIQRSVPEPGRGIGALGQLTGGALPAWRGPCRLKHARLKPRARPGPQAATAA
jgi:hypothetical protein